MGVVVGVASYNDVIEPKSHSLQAHPKKKKKKKRARKTTVAKHQGLSFKVFPMEFFDRLIGLLHVGHHYEAGATVFAALLRRGRFGAVFPLCI